MCYVVVVHAVGVMAGSGKFAIGMPVGGVERLLSSFAGPVSHDTFKRQNVSCSIRVIKTKDRQGI